MGDFNDILLPSEKLGSLPRNLSQLNKFVFVLSNNGMQDLGFVG